MGLPGKASLKKADFLNDRIIFHCREDRFIPVEAPFIPLQPLRYLPNGDTWHPKNGESHKDQVVLWSEYIS